MRHIEPHLSRKAQARWPSALVTHNEHSEHNADWRLDRAGEPSIGLGATYRDAARSLAVLINADRQAHA